MGTDFSIEVESREPRIVTITDEEVERHYRVHVPSGEPPLAAIREHVVRTAEPDPIAVLHARFVDDYTHGDLVRPVHHPARWPALQAAEDSRSGEATEVCYRGPK